MEERDSPRVGHEVGPARWEGGRGRVGCGTRASSVSNRKGDAAAGEASGPSLSMSPCMTLMCTLMGWRAPGTPVSPSSLEMCPGSSPARGTSLRPPWLEFRWGFTREGRSRCALTAHPDPAQAQLFTAGFVLSSSFFSSFFFSSTGTKSLKIAVLPVSAGNVKPG